MSTQADDDVGHDDIVYPSALPFALVHVGCLAAIWTGVTLQALVICVALYVLRMIAICGGYHRYFSHRSFATSRAFQFILALLAQTTTQKSVLWWAAVHRQHHLHSDTELDVHSPRHNGFLYSHLGWMFNRKFDKPDLSRVGDFTRYPELIWLHRYEQAPSIALALLCLAIAGWPGLVVGFFWSTVLLYHATFSINSLAHVHGKKRHVTGDDSRNNWLLALITMGEGWHNNHHAYQSSVRQGFKWWEIDPTYYVLRALSWLGVVWDMKAPPDAVLHNEQRLGAKIVHRAAEQLAARFHPEAIALAICAALNGPQLNALRIKLSETQKQATEAWANVHLPEMPTRDMFCAEAKAIFAKTASLDEIVDRAYQLLLVSVGRKLLLDPVNTQS
jgi:stearoyl-CoA desaturase (delta-9 desaturase)